MARKATMNKTNTTAKEPASKSVEKVEKVEAAKPVNVLADSPKEEEKTVAKPAQTAKKTTTRKTAAKKTTTRKTTSRKTTRKETLDVKADVFVQFGGFEYSEKNIMEKVVAQWEAEGKKISAIKRTKLYVKPEDKKAYYVINEGLKNGTSGAVDL